MQVQLSRYMGEHGFERYLSDVEEKAEFEALKMIAIDIAMETGKITADDLREYCERIGIEIKKDRRIFGAVLAKLARDGFLKKADYVPSKVPTSHGRPIAKFVLAKKSAGGFKRASEVIKCQG